MRTDRDALTASFAFDLDDFQIRALDALDDGESVLVAAPTGSGKTAVAEYAIRATLADGRRSFYTTPVKALSNQKYRDLCDDLGAGRVGLLTGDTSVNGEAEVVVMTTEVLRNMIYANSPALRRLGLVVLDEVHFLQDAYRGPVWEEVIVHLPAAIRLVCLSATVSNASEVAEWITTVRGPTRSVVEERRPVRLENHYLVGDATNDRLQLLPTLVAGRPNSDARRLDDEGSRHARRGQRHARRRLFTPSRIDVIDLLAERGMLPAIYFIFSRNQCDEAARSCLSAGIRLTTGDERDRIAAICDERLGGLSDADLAVLGYGQFMAQLDAGIATHHAGMIPPFKEVVEVCFVEGLVKVVFATETLAVGINMPAKCVVIEKLTKFTGDHHTQLTPAEYTQLTGRAGRRGLDDHGNAVVLWTPWVGFDQVAVLAASRSFHLRSAFRPTYNMAANLVRTCTSERAHHLLNLSFAQFQADRDVVRLEARLDNRRQRHSELLEMAHSPFGDLDDFRRRSASTTPSRDDPVETALGALRPGDIIHARKGRFAGRVVVLSTASRKGGVKLSAVTPARDLVQLSVVDFDEIPDVVGHVELPTGYSPHVPEYRREVVRRLERAVISPRPHLERGSDRLPPTHPVEDDPDLDERLKAASRAERVAAEIADLESRIEGRGRSVARDFDRVLSVLESWGYVSDWSLTTSGRVLVRVFHESDLLVAECLVRGLLDDLDAPALAGLVSTFVYEHRSPEPPPAPVFPSPLVRRRWRDVLRTSDELHRLEIDAGLAEHRSPDPGFIDVAAAWAAGDDFADVVDAAELSGGDFVRTIRQLVDLLRQIALVAPSSSTRDAARAASDGLFRGIIAASAEPGET
ncbi:MAG: DEAD/DEAH box helicase [Ilumatobacteraceae bacterium]